MKDKVVSTIKKYNMIPPGSRVIVALSGGSDSMSLLTALLMLKGELQFTLEAAHINHGLRGQDADDDESFVRNFCAQNSIPLHILKADVMGEAQKTGESLEEAGRRIRYEFFSSLGDDCLIATAHNLNDRIETFIFNFTRGASLKGLCSIPPVRGNIIRPLIECTKADVLNFCTENNIAYCTDKTNSETVYTRNKIRHNVVTQLKEINRSLEKSAERCFEALNEDEEYLLSLGCELAENCKAENGYDIKKLYSSPAPVRKRALALIIESETNSFPDFLTINAVDGLIKDYSENSEGKAIDICAGVARTGSGLLKFPKKEKPFNSSVNLENGTNLFGKYKIEIKTGLKDTVCSHINSAIGYNYVVDREKICGSLTATVRQAEDKLSLPGRNITKAVRKIQNEKGIPPEERCVLPVIRDEKGIILAAGCGIDKRTAVTEETKELLYISISESK